MDSAEQQPTTLGSVRGDKIYITMALLEELRPIAGDLSLKSLVELLGWLYTDRKVRGRTLKVCVVGYKTFINFLTTGIK